MFFGLELALLVYLFLFFCWAAYCYEEKGEEMTLQQQQGKTKSNSKERHAPIV